MVAALTLALAGNASAAYDDSFLSMSTACDEITYTSPSSNHITFTLDTEYECGQFANGDWYVIPNEPEGSVVVTGISPAATGSGSTFRNGATVNPATLTGNNQSYDGRAISFQSGGVITFNYSAEAGESIVKYVSREDEACSGGSPDNCGQFAAVLTVLDEAPADPANTFRPPYFGTYKPMFEVDDLDLDLLLRLDSACCQDKITRTQAVNRTRYLRLATHPSSVSAIEPYDAFPEDGASWGGDILKKDTEVLNWLMLDDACASPPCSAQQDLDAKMEVLVGFVQYGIDVWAAYHGGTNLLRGGGGNAAGRLFTLAFTAAMLDDTEIDTDLAGAAERDFWESFSIYAGDGGIPLWGQMPGANQTFAQWEEDYWDEFPDCNNCNLRDPYGEIDGGAKPGTSYQRSTMLPTKYAAMLMRLVPEMQTVWPGTHDQTFLGYADRVVAAGARTIPDTCKTKSGTYGLDYGPLSGNPGSCVLNTADDPANDNGRAPDRHGDTTDGDGASRRSAFGDQIWSSFRHARLLAPEDGTAIGVDEPFGVQPYGTGNVKVQFASDSGFSTIVCDTGWFSDGPDAIEWTYPGPIGASAVSCPLDPGTYYWRAQWGGAGTSGPFSLVQSFSVNADCNTDDTSDCVPGAVLELNETDFVCDEPLENIADEQNGVLPLLVRITSDEPVDLSALVDLKTGCHGDGNTAVTLSSSCTSDSSTCYSGSGYVPGQVDLILDIDGNGATFGGRDTIVKVRQAARDIVITGQVDCGPRGPGANQIYARTSGGNDDLRQDAVLVQGGERITFVDVKSGNWATQTSTCMAANGGFDVDEVNSSFPVEDVVCIGCEMVTCSRGLVVDDTLRSGAINSFFRTGDPQWKLVDLPATGSDNGVDAGQCWSDTAASFFGGSAVNPINVGNFYDRWPYSVGGD